MPEMSAHQDCASAETVDDGFDIKGLDEMGHLIWGFFQYLQNRMRQLGYDGALEGDVILPFGHD